MEQNIKIILIQLFILFLFILLFTIIKKFQNIKPIMPSILPTTDQLTEKKYSSTLAILNIYFIQVIIYLFQTDQLQFPNNPYNKIIKFLPQGTNIIKILNYTCSILTVNINSIGKPTTIGGMILEYNNTSFIVLRGTQLDCEWKLDATLLLEKPSWAKFTKDFKVHGGFNYVYTSISDDGTNLRDEIFNYLVKKNPENIIITGHSIGGGLCNLIAADMSINFPNFRSKTKFFTTAAPYSGNQEFVNSIMNSSISPVYTGIFSTINNSDPVPTTKLPGYTRIPSQLFCFSEPGKSAHLPITYRKGLEKNAAQFDSGSSLNKVSCGLDCK